MGLFRPRISSRRQTASRRLRRAHPACCSVTRPLGRRAQGFRHPCRRSNRPDPPRIRTQTRRRAAVRCALRLEGGTRSLPERAQDRVLPSVGRVGHRGSVRFACRGCADRARAAVTRCRGRLLRRAAQNLDRRRSWATSSANARSLRIRGPPARCPRAAGRRVRRRQDPREGFAGWPPFLPSAVQPGFAEKLTHPAARPHEVQIDKRTAGGIRVGINHVRTPR